MAKLGIGENNKFKSVQKRLKAMRKPIIKKCIGCEKIDSDDNTLCSVYIDPGQIWRLGNCPAATHLQEEEKPKTKTRVGQQKQKKN